MDESAPLLLYPAGVPVSGAQETEKTYGAFAACMSELYFQLLM